MAAPDLTSYWLLIAVLSSSIPLSPEQATRLYQAALRIHRGGQKVEKLQGDLMTGRVVALGTELALGSVTGPAFEAKISTERGEGLVRFLLTRQGLREDEEDEPAPPAGIPPLTARGLARGSLPN